ncbi:TPA: hypothetical protein ACT5CR_007555 [Burkholderia cenocepacia]|uniref:hypothetical protein n=1 Tax=Burkholderia cenocepacia TaxID=95486 RepID=UPI001C12AC2A|nr:hypothetical protein [Burkholderia cenocepacia]MCW3674243.1 hypothetical protein [Burkholderia cenocepacia]MDC6084331.1 hypothetical protein [Burkholderia cenocepacia]
MKSDDGKVSLRVTRFHFLKAWAKRADAGIKSTDDVAVILDNEVLYTDVFVDDAAAYRFAELLVKKTPVEMVVKPLLLAESRDEVPEGANMLAVAVRRGEGLCPLAGGASAADRSLWGGAGG